MKKTYLTILISIFLSTSANAGFNGITFHSRANCGNNETITWDATQPHNFYTRSIHFFQASGNSHEIKIPLEMTRRSAAVHWGEGIPPGSEAWMVIGAHYLLENNIYRHLGEEYITDCSIYDGWWDFTPEFSKQNQTSIKKHIEAIDPATKLTSMKGVQVLSLDKINISDSYKKSVLENDAEQRSKGYYDFESDYPKQLINKGNNSNRYIDNNSDPYDTRLKTNLSLIKLAFPYKSISNSIPVEFIGYAVIGTWKDNGWTGIKEFFKKDSLGTCTYSLNNFRLTQGGVQIPNVVARKNINNKTTVINVKGNPSDGFLYTITWLDKEFIHDLECANLKFNSNITDEMIDLAKVIDKNLTK